MRTRAWAAAWAGCLVGLVFSYANAAPQQGGDVGPLELSGGHLAECSIGYRTYGVLNADKTNVVIFPTWLTGRTADLEAFIGPGKLVDSSHWYVVTLDAIGDGVSCSPSNSKSNPRLKFPQFSISDMVKSQHRLLVTKLGINHVHAVVGMSMGGLQSLQWSVLYPKFANKIVAIVASPQPTSQDLLTWTSELRSIDESVAWQNGNYTDNTKFKALAAIQMQALWTPTNRARTTPRAGVADFIAQQEQQMLGGFSVVDWYRQLQALASFDLVGSSGMSGLAAKITAPMLIVTSTQDHMMNPGPATALATASNAQLLALDNDCGHIAPICELDLVSKTIAEFLQ